MLRFNVGRLCADPTNNRPPIIARFFKKFMSCPTKTGVPAAASQNACPTNVASTRNAIRATAATLGNMPKASASPPMSSTLRPTSIRNGTRADGTTRAARSRAASVWSMTPRAFSKKTIEIITRAIRIPYRENRSITKTSKFVSGPKGDVVDVSPRGCLSKELASVKNPVIRLKVSVTINLPTNFHSGPIADEASPAAVGRDEQKPRHRENRGVEALPPLGNKIRRNRYPAYRLDLKPRVQVNEILRAGSRVGQHPKIVADRKQSIERSQAVVARVVTA